jgi:hypothetical protein
MVSKNDYEFSLPTISILDDASLKELTHLGISELILSSPSSNQNGTKPLRLNIFMTNHQYPEGAAGFYEIIPSNSQDHR